MFGWVPKGQRNFKACQVRSEVEQRPVPVAKGNILSFDDANGQVAAENHPALPYERTARFACKLLGQVELTTTATAENAKVNLVKKVAKESCKRCVFVGMSPLEANQYIEDQKNAVQAQTQQPEPMTDVIQGVDMSAEPNPSLIKRTLPSKP